MARGFFKGGTPLEQDNSISEAEEYGPHVVNITESFGGPNPDLIKSTSEQEDRSVGVITGDNEKIDRFGRPVMALSKKPVLDGNTQDAVTAPVIRLGLTEAMEFFNSIYQDLIAQGYNRWRIPPELVMRKVKEKLFPGHDLDKISISIENLVDEWADNKLCHNKLEYDFPRDRWLSWIHGKHSSKISFMSGQKREPVLVFDELALTFLKREKIKEQMEEKTNPNLKARRKLRKQLIKRLDMAKDARVIPEKPHTPEVLPTQDFVTMNALIRSLENALLYRIISPEELGANHLFTNEALSCWNIKNNPLLMELWLIGRSWITGVSCVNMHTIITPEEKLDSIRHELGDQPIQPVNRHEILSSFLSQEQERRIVDEFLDYIYNGKIPSQNALKEMCQRILGWQFPE